jgi:GNAT superfamily N-acetyltransferase
LQGPHPEGEALVILLVLALNTLLIRPIQPRDQEAVRALILAGLSEHFGALDTRLNRDLDDIWHNYISCGNHFLVAVSRKDIVGTGALIEETPSTGRIVRLSVEANHRRHGIGSLLVHALVRVGSRAGYETIVVETNDDWHVAIKLYRRCGFSPYDYFNNEIHMCLKLAENN